MQTLSIKDGVAEVDGDLVLGGIIDQMFGETKVRQGKWQKVVK